MNYFSGDVSTRRFSSKLFIGAMFFLASWFAPGYTAESITTVNMADGRELTLNGMGAHTVLNNEMYIAALYVQQQTSLDEDVLNEFSPKRMEMRITAKRVTKGRFTRMWQEFMSINNDREEFTRYRKAVIKFLQFFKKTLKAGDVVQIDFIPNEGSTVYINGVRLGIVREPEFFSLLLNAWIGERPPSEEFKAGLMRRKIDPAIQLDLQQRFVSIQPTKKRIQEIKDWLKKADNSSSKLPDMRKKAVAASSSNKSSPKKVVKKNTTASATAKETAKKSTAQSEKKADVVSSQKTIDKTDEKDNKIKDSKVVAAENQNKVVEAKQTSESTADNTTKKKTLEVAKTERPPSADLLAKRVQQNRDRRSFRKVIYQHVNKHLTYPAKAYRRKLEGEGSVLVRIDREGKLIFADMVVSTGERILDKATLNMVKKAGPYPVIPESLPETEFEHTIPVVFKMGN